MLNFWVTRLRKDEDELSTTEISSLFLFCTFDLLRSLSFLYCGYLESKSTLRNTISDFSFPTWDDVVYEQLLCNHFHFAKYLWITTLSELLRIMLIKDQNVTQPAIFKHLPRYSKFGPGAFDISFCDHCDCLFFMISRRKTLNSYFTSPWLKNSKKSHTLFTQSSLLGNWPIFVLILKI